MLKNTEKLTWILFALVIVGVYLFALDLPLLGPDEPRYSQVAREMYERGDWVTTTLGGYNWFEKPALLYWLQITFYNIFGTTEFAARLGSALFGLGTILSLWILGRNIRITNAEGQNTNPQFANWLGLIAASSLGLLVFARGASFDIMITFPVTASLVSFFIWETKSSKSNEKSFAYWLIPFYVFMGIGVIAKGLIGIVFPFAIVAFYYVLRLKIPNKTFLFSLIWGTILSVVVASVWYLQMYLTNGWEFIDEFFLQHHFKRYTSNEYKHPQPFWFFWVIFPLFVIPWIPFFLLAIWNLFRRGDMKPQNNDNEKNLFTKVLKISPPPLLIFSISWMLVPLVFFTFSGSKLPGYIMPAVPAAVIFTAEYVFRFIQKSNTRKYALQGLAGLTFAVVVVLLQFVVPHFAEEDSTRHLVQNASTQGYKTEKILNMHTINHNIEFYGSGRLVRESDGKQKKFSGPKEIDDYLKKENASSVLVLIPHKFVPQLTDSDLFDAKVIDKNAELTFVAVEKK